MIQNSDVKWMYHRAPVKSLAGALCDGGRGGGSWLMRAGTFPMSVSGSLDMCQKLKVEDRGIKSLGGRSAQPYEY
jgi:hypothetical protein